MFNRSGVGKKKELTMLVKNCNGVLQQLNNLLTKYESLGTTSKRTWDRLKRGTENLSEIREKIMSHTSSMTLFLTTLGTGSLGRIEKKLDQLIENVRTGKREETIVSIANNDDDDAELQMDWLKREMVGDDFTMAELERHKNWIKAKLMEHIESGRLHEEALPDIADSPDDMMLPNDSISSRGTITIPGVPGFGTSYPLSSIAHQYSELKAKEFEGQSTYYRADYLQVNPPPIQRTPHLSPDSFDNIIGASTPVVETLYIPTTPTPPQFSENTVIEKSLPLTLQELFTGIHKKRKVKNKRNLRETVCEIDKAWA
jgi:hypothetical protein